MKTILEKIGGRKMLLSLLIFISSTVLVYFSKLDQESYFTVVKYIVLIYLGGNVLQAGLVKKLDSKVQFAEEIVGIVTEGQTLDQMGGRKFLFVIGVFLTAVVLLLLKIIEAGIYVDIANWLALAYIGTNVGSKAIQQGVTVSVNAPEQPL